MTPNPPRALAAPALATALLLVAATFPAPAASAPPLPALSEKQVESYRDLVNQGNAALGEDDALKAVRSYRRAIRLHDGNEGTWYNLACAEARRGQTALALEALERAAAAGWSDASWPAEDSDLASLHDTLAFREWLASVEESAAVVVPWPVPDPATLADSGEAIDEQAQAREAAVQALAGALGNHANQEASREIAAWKAASWDRVAAGRADAAGRSEAAFSALRAVTGRDATRVSAGAAAEALGRAQAFVKRHPDAEQAGAARLIAAEAAFALARAERSEDARDDFERALLMLAATEEGEAAEGALVHLFGLNATDPQAADRLLARLEALAGAEAARERLVTRERGAYYKLRGLPDFEATTLEGQEVRPATLTGRVTLIDFWATWCGPCKAELPHLKKTYAELHGDGFHVLGISLDSAKDMDAEAFRAWCAENGLTWPQVYDGKGWQAALAERFGVKSIPFPILVDAQGRVVATDGEVRGEALEARVRAELANAATAAGLSGQ